jgi:anti-sigma-K factor RskA
MQVVAMLGTEVAPAATGMLVISEDGEYGTLVVDGLPALDPAHQYQLWLIRDGQRTSGGLFSVNPEGYGSLWVSSPEPLSSYPAFGITVEPVGGSTGPTGEKVLGTGS